MNEAPARDPQASRLPGWLRSTSVAWAGSLLVLLVAGLTAGFLFHEYQALEESELQSAALYARVLQDHAERTFDTIDIAMAAIADDIGTEMRADDTGRLNQQLTQALGGLPFMRSLSLMTAEGRVIASSSPSNVDVTVDLATVRLPPAGTGDALGSSVDGRDLVDVPRSGPARPAGARTFVPLVRAVGRAGAGGRYVVAVLNPDFFATEYELTLADPTRAAAIFSIGGVMLGGTSNLQKAPGQSARDHRFFTAYLPARESGSFVGPGIDGGQVVTAFRVLRKRPLVIVVERGQAEVLAVFRLTLWRALGICAATLGVILATVVVARRSLKGQESFSEALESTRLGIAASERDLRVLVESVHELIFRADADGRIAFVNGRWQELTQRPPTDVIGKRVTDLCRDDERPALYAMFRELQTRDATILVHVGHAAGHALTLDLSVSRVVDAEGRLAGFAGFAVDVSDREAAQQALRSQLKFTAQLIEMSPTPVFVKDERGRFVTVNKAWLDLMNLNLPEVLGRDSADLFGAEAPRHKDQDARLLDSEDRISYENRLLVEGRPPRDTVVTKVRFTRAEGTPAGIVGSIVDVTEFREAERDIRKARDAAQLANSAKSEFIANISHELRTPLQGIIGFSEIGREMAADVPDFHEMFADIHAGGQRMLTLVNGLLDVAQMDSAVGSLPLQRTDLAPLVLDAVAQLKPQAVVRDLAFDLRGLDRPLEGDVDRARFQQAVRNVLANAVRYSPVGGAIEVGLSDEGAAGIVLAVRDQGPGIPPDELEQVFEAFVQSSRTRDGSGGAGLGLTIARKIMGAHGGSIVAANAEGGGARVSLSLPAAGAAIGASHDLDPQAADGLLHATEVN